MMPLRVRVRMAKPVCAIQGAIHLDGLVAVGAYRSLSREHQNAVPPITSAWALDFDLPLARWERECLIPEGVNPALWESTGERDGRQVGMVWGWCASASCVDWKMDTLEPLRKKPPIDAMVRWSDDARIETATGPLKMHDKKYPLRWADTLAWYCVGDPVELARALSFVTHIGRGSGHGWGAIALDDDDLPRWQIDPWSYDWSITGPDNQAMRHMPDQNAPSRPVLRHTAIRAPYHHTSRRFPILPFDWEALSCPSLAGGL